MVVGVTDLSTLLVYIVVCFTVAHALPFCCCFGNLSLLL